MSKNINQVFVANPITTNLGTDLMYFGRSPYGATDDAAMTFTNFSAQFSSFPWTSVTGTTQALAVNHGYIANNAALVTMTLPSTAAFGSIIEVAGGVSGTGLWTIAQNAGQSIIINGVSSTVGVGGSVAANTQYSSIRLICVVANTTFTSLGGIGSYTVT